MLVVRHKWFPITLSLYLQRSNKISIACKKHEENTTIFIKHYIKFLNDDNALISFFCIVISAVYSKINTR